MAVGSEGVGARGGGAVSGVSSNPRTYLVEVLIRR